MKKCTNLANSTYNLHVLYIKLTQNTKQFRRLVLENFISVIHFLFGRNAFYGLRAAEHLPPPPPLEYILL